MAAWRRGDRERVERAPPIQEHVAPCGYFVAGNCAYGSGCALVHSVDFALAIRDEWLSAGERGAQNRLRDVAVSTVGEAAVEKAALFPRVFSQHLGPAAPSAAAAAPQVQRQKRWSRRSEPVVEDPSDDGFAWDSQPQLAVSSPAAPAPPGSTMPRYLLVFDLEGKYEIIEFPLLIIDTVTQSEVGRFQRFVRPAKLFDGLDIVADSPAVPFEVVLSELSDWLKAIIGCSLDELTSQALFLSCGDFDCKHVRKQCEISGLPLPPAFREWVNIKRTWATIYGGEFRGMKSMLARMGQLDECGNVRHGFHHLGMHDVENIARCVLRVLQEGHDIVANGWIPA